MKKILFLVCVFFVCLGLFKEYNLCFAESDYVIEFEYEKTIFSYKLEENRKTDSIFYSKSIHSQYDTSTQKSRKELLTRLTKANIPKDLSLAFIFPNIDKTFAKIENYLKIEVRNADLKINTSKEKVFSYSNEVTGRLLDKQSLLEDLYDVVINEKTPSIKLKTISIYPQITVNDLKKFTNLRSDFSTDISSSTNERKHNIKNALSSINLTTLYPNEIFSFNDVVGRRTEENGYRIAKIIVNNEFVEGLGGGVCQVSTTLYNSALIAGLEILEANKHSRPVHYVKAGFDAMVNFGSSDLKFKNNTNEKLIIVTNYTSNKIRIRIFGEDLLDTKYVLSSEIEEVYKANEIVKIDDKQEFLDKVEYNDEFFYEKKASDGLKVSSYRIKYKENSPAEHEKLRTDIFKPIDAIKIYGSKSRNITDVD